MYGIRINLSNMIALRDLLRGGFGIEDEAGFTFDFEEIVGNNANPSSLGSKQDVRVREWSTADDLVGASWGVADAPEKRCDYVLANCVLLVLGIVHAAEVQRTEEFFF